MKEKSKKKKDLGFQAFVDEIFKKKQKRQSIKRSTNYNVEGFIQSNIVILQKILSFFEDKVQINKDFNQTRSLISEQKSINSQLKDRIIDDFLKPDSLTNKSLSRIFNAYFKS